MAKASPGRPRRTSAAKRFSSSCSVARDRAVEKRIARQTARAHIPSSSTLCEMSATKSGPTPTSSNAGL